MGGLGFVARILASRSFLTKTGGEGGASSLSCVVCSARVEEGKKRVARF